MNTQQPFLPSGLNYFDSIEQEAKAAVGYMKALEFYQANPEASTVDCAHFLAQEGF